MRSTVRLLAFFPKSPQATPVLAADGRWRISRPFTLSYHPPAPSEPMTRFMTPDDAVRDQRVGHPQTEGLQLTLDETLALHAVMSHAERVDWAVYERLRLRLLSWPSSMCTPTKR